MYPDEVCKGKGVIDINEKCQTCEGIGEINVCKSCNKIVPENTDYCTECKIKLEKERE